MEDKKLVFGVGSINEPTPKFLKAIFRGVSFVTGLWGVAQFLDLGLASHVTDVINKWCVAVVPLIHFTIKFFRYDYTDN